MTDIRTCLWFDGRVDEAAAFYTALIPGSRIESRVGQGGDGGPLMVNLTLGGVPYQLLNGGAHYQLTPAASIALILPDQAEVDRLWTALTADGGAESMCGWCTDRFGLSWQVIPEVLTRTVGGPDPEGAARATQAMLKMRKLDAAALEAAYNG